MDIILVLRSESLQTRLCDKFGKITATTPGGRERQDSVLAGFKCLDCRDKDIVLVHDGVRPLVSSDLISRVIAAAQEKGAAVPVIPLEDTVKQVHNESIVQTLDRSDLKRAQTPQGFHYIILKAALEKVRQDSYQGTDEASLVERLGYTVQAVSGEASNIKITTPGDLKIAEALLED
jgi:2-C-methyl-D-erythritol 4-phosphate cytidylyltransferase